MEPLPKATAAEQADRHQLIEADTEADLTRICWTQLLRQVPEATEKLPPLKRSPNDFPIDKLFS